jgi:hypothetical protein
MPRKLFFRQISVVHFELHGCSLDAPDIPALPSAPEEVQFLDCRRSVSEGLVRRRLVAFQSCEGFV